MESNLRSPVLVVNGKEKEMVHQKKISFSWFLKFCRVLDDRIVLVVCSMTLARRLQKHSHQSWSSNVEHGDITCDLY